MNKALIKWKGYEKSKVKKKFVESRKEQHRKNDTKQRKYCVKLQRKAKGSYYENLDEK